eukprot:19090_1
MISSYYVDELRDDTEAIRQLQVTANKITDGQFEYLKGNVIDFNSPKFQQYRESILLDDEGVIPFTVDLRKCETQHEKKVQFHLELFQLPKKHNNIRAQNCEM